MTEIKYLTHYTTIENCINILQNNYIYTNIERVNKKIVYKGVASEYQKTYTDKDFTPSEI